MPIQLHDLHSWIGRVVLHDLDIVVSTESAHRIEHGVVGGNDGVLRTSVDCDPGITILTTAAGRAAGVLLVLASVGKGNRGGAWEISRVKAPIEGPQAEQLGLLFRRR